MRDGDARKGSRIPQCVPRPLVLEMDRVLKRVGLSKRSQSEIKVQNSGATEEPSKVRRRRRSKSRRRTNVDTTKKTRGLFNIDWESVKYCKSCKSKAITRRLCSRRCDNELYRSNSFKFERFVRGNDEISTIGKKVTISLSYSNKSRCPRYSNTISNKCRRKIEIESPSKIPNCISYSSNYTYHN